ncbi:inorganic polyphosphate/ATP-NAD kinase [Aeropyrum camini SY1 = JCM 12091]|uniref:NAD kinase n=1 Tax=Aeropyrum camini SY1 = JCM 12091 TaxID=1198449 RepID=U3TDT5_9CREN|nr:inorganic polyphosphate/ATP-NAD kinase [Aeropyrum camini SY1 = JCM 12091]
MTEALALGDHLLAGAVGLVVKRRSGIAEDVARLVVKELAERGVEVLVDETVDYPSLSHLPRFSISRDPPGRVVVVGGDGTLLRTFLRLGERESPLFMTIKAGKKGFLLDVERYEAVERLRDFLDGRFREVVYPRYRVYLEGEARGCMFNDTAVTANNAKMARVHVFVDGDLAMNIDGDGVVVSTTAGSTAYSLSGGGPIIDPRLDVMVLTPLNPVQLFLRSIVVPSGSRVTVEASVYSNPLVVNIDGQYVYELEPGGIVDIERCGSGVRIARFRWWEDYYERLYTRLLAYW